MQIGSEVVIPLFIIYSSLSRTSNFRYTYMKLGIIVLSYVGHVLPEG
jgi:hypothetical protein